MTQTLNKIWLDCKALKATTFDLPLSGHEISSWHWASGWTPQLGPFLQNNCIPLNKLLWE